MKTTLITPQQLNIERCGTHYKWLFWAKKKRLSVNINLLSMEVKYMVWHNNGEKTNFDVLQDAVKFYNSIP